MVMLNTNTTTIPIIPIIKGIGFRVEPDWLSTRDEVTDGYKRFYALVVRRIGKRGFAYLSTQGLAQDLCVCTRTISNYIKTSRELNLMEITPTGRSHRFVILWHPWMSISLEQAQRISLNSNLSENFSTQRSKIFQNGSPQTKENQQANSNLKNLETIVTEPIKDLRSMHASEVASSSNNTDSNTDKEKEVINPTVTTKATPSVSSNNPKEELTQQPKSVYTLEIILKWVLAYAMTKLGTSDEIRDHRALATTFLRTGEKDPWIAKFIHNGCVLSAINPLKDHPPQQEQHSKVNQATKFSPKQARQAKEQSNEPVEIKGKYPYPVYLDFANYEVKQGKDIHSVEKLADYLYTTGSQDHSQVAQFVELMNNTWAGGRPSQSTQPSQRVEAQHPTPTQSAQLAQQTTEPKQANNSSPSLEATLIEEPPIDILGKRAYRDLTKAEKELFFNTVAFNLSYKNPSFEHLAEEKQRSEILSLVYKKLGEVYAKSPNGKIDVILEEIGKKEFQLLEIDQQRKLIDKRIDIKGRDFFELCRPIVRQGLLEEIEKDISIDLALMSLAKL